MSTLTEVLLIIVITTLTLTLTIIGVQVFLILRDLRERISKFDAIIENVSIEQQYLNEILISAKDVTQRASSTTKYISEEVIQPIASLVSVVKTVSQFVNQFRSARTPKREYIEQETEKRR